jgi:predicted MPP superfamily phosphohydrolase
MHPQFYYFLFPFIVYTLINCYIVYRSKQALPRSKNIRIVFSVIYFFFYSAFILAMLGRNIFPLTIQKILYIPGTFWLGMMVYFFAFFLLTDFIYLIIRLFCRLSSGFKKQYRKIQVLTGCIVVFCLASYGYYEFTNPKVVELNIKIDKQAGKYKNLKVVGVSDIHMGVAVDKKRLKQYVRLINEQRPDLIIMAGDLIDHSTMPLEKERMWQELNELQAPLGTYICYGNHEHIAGIEDTKSFFQKTNLHVLVDDFVLIDESIQLVGLDDVRRNRQGKSLKEVIEGADHTLPLLLLFHEPVHLEEAEKNGIDLQFSGHTHQGQMFPGNLLVKLRYEHTYGYKRSGNTHYYVTSGLGLWGPPFRIGTRSEIVVFNIEFN